MVGVIPFQRVSESFSVAFSVWIAVDNSPSGGAPVQLE
jgi:hypothetical protein